MSTKSTLMSFKNAHLYHEAFDNSHIYLTLDNINFEVSNTQVNIEIPYEMWEVIRQGQAFTPRYADWTDEYIKSYVEGHVAERVGAEGISRMFGMMIYGDSNRHPDEQIRDGVDYFTKERAVDQEIIAKIEVNKIDAAIRPSPDFSLLGDDELKEEALRLAGVMFNDSKKALIEELVRRIK